MTNIISINLLIDIKKELNELIIEDVTPSVFDGILEIYNGTKEISNDTTIMKTFQKCMEKICNWDDSKVNHAINILEKRLSPPDGSGSSRLEKLKKVVTAILRINTQIIHYQNPSLEEELSKISLVKFENFIRKVYVESARRIWSQPYLFYEKGLNSIEIKRNHIIICDLIKQSVLSAIRKLVISNNAIDYVLSGSYQIQNPQQAEVKYEVNQTGGDLNGKDEILNIINKNLKVSESDKNTIELNQNAFNNFTPREEGSDIKSSSTLKKIVNESFDNNHNSQNSEKHSIHNSSRHSIKNSSKHNSSRHSTHSEHASLRNSSRHSSKDSRHSTRYNTATNNISIDTSVKNNLIKDLMTDTVSYNPEDGNDKYQDIFSNSEVPDNTNRKVSKNLSKDKENFYNNYLKK